MSACWLSECRNKLSGIFGRTARLFRSGLCEAHSLRLRSEATQAEGEHSYD